jgi:hypothetical protein
MNVSLVAAVTMVLGWIALVFVAQVPSGWVHVLYVGAVLLFARRILLGAPKFVS